MEIITKQRNFGNSGKLSVTERRNISDRRDSLKAQLNRNQEAGREVLETVTQQGAIQTEITKLDNQLAKDQGLVAQGVEKDALVKTANELASKIKNVMPPMHIQAAKPGTKE